MKRRIARNSTLMDKRINFYNPKGYTTKSIEYPEIEWIRIDDDIVPIHAVYSPFLVRDDIEEYDVILTSSSQYSSFSDAHINALSVFSSNQYKTRNWSDGSIRPVHLRFDRNDFKHYFGENTEVFIYNIYIACNITKDVIETVSLVRLRDSVQKVFSDLTLYIPMKYLRIVIP